ncbi:hypothetical protein GCM10009838_52810 [Catenulispora subtropica]|uniref:SHOCT domain-containing protein n=2 Tax=Catenulispora subtropica TaxID=450798 RepID=A0ABP5DTN0_9ACTN
MVQGHSGSVEVGPDTITIMRGGLAGTLIGGSGPRTIPYRALSAVAFQDATRGTDGYLAFAFGGRPLPAPADAVKHPNAVVFRHRDQEEFARLYQYLKDVVAFNLANGVDVAGVYAGSGDPLLGVTDAEMDGGAGTIGTGDGERPDIDAAAARLKWTLGSKREIKKLPEHLMPGETVTFMAAGHYSKAHGLIVLTDKRLLFLWHGFTGSQMVDFPLAAVSSVETKTGMANGTLTIYSAGKSSEIDHVLNGDLKLLADAIRQATTGARSGPAARSAAAPTPASPSPDADITLDPTEQIRKLADLHAAGILTDQEFATKKAELLGRI